MPSNLDKRAQGRILDKQFKQKSYHQALTLESLSSYRFAPDYRAPIGAAVQEDTLQERL